MTDEAYAAHKRLMQLAEAKTQIFILCNRIEELKTIATAAGTSGTGERVQTSAEPDRMDRTIIKLMEEQHTLALFHESSSEQGSDEVSNGSENTKKQYQS